MESGSSFPGFSLGDLPTELTILLLSCVLGFLQLFLAAGAITQERGVKWNAGPRDEVAPPPGPKAGRLDRAYKNFMETFPFFAVAVLVAWTTARFGTLTTIGAELYFVGRVLYVPLYAAGVPFVRSMAWTASLIGIILVVVGAFTPS